MSCFPKVLLLRSSLLQVQSEVDLYRYTVPVCTPLVPWSSAKTKNKVLQLFLELGHASEVGGGEVELQKHGIRIE